MTTAGDRKWRHVAVSIVGVVVIGFIDYITGYEVRLFPLYFLPVGYGAWRLTRTFAVTLSLMSAAAWAISNWEAGSTYSAFWIWPVNFTSQLVAFGTIALLIVSLRRRLTLEQSLSRQDALTSLMNRRAFSEYSALLISVARRTRQRLTVVQIDLDNFKTVNDQRGHREGDRLLATIGGALARHFRSSDLVCRLGGDEFAILLPDTGPDAARASFERLRDVVGAAMRHHGWPVTLSAGGVTYEHSYPQTMEEALHEADIVMYRAKREGRNRIYIDAVSGDAGSAGSAPLAAATEPEPRGP